jgi:hypothetical protein
MQTLIAANPGAMQDGKFAVSNAANLTVPPDLQQALATSTGNSTGAAGAAAGSAAAAGAGSATSASPASTSAPSNGAGSMASSSIAVGLFAVVATFFAL